MNTFIRFIYNLKHSFPILNQHLQTGANDMPQFRFQ